MKVLLTHAYFLNEDPRERLIMKPYVPLGILYVSAFLEQHHIANEVFDSTFSDFDKQCSFIVNNQPDVLALYCNLMTKVNVVKLIRYVKAHPALGNVRIVLGGPEIRHNAQGYLQAGADLLVEGEGEITFYELCKYFELNGKLPVDLPGTIFLSQQGELCRPGERALVKDLNVLPMPARGKVNLSKYGDTWKKHHGYRTFSISTMRGCPYTCKWCSRAVYGGTYRRRSPELVAEEMQLLLDQYQAERIWFVDDVFTISHKWLKEFTAEIKRRNLKLPYEIITRADRMNDEVIGLLRESGCFRVWIGAESGSQTIIDAMDRRVDVTQVRQMIIRTKEAGMEAGTFIMLGYPGEGKKEIRETLEHLRLSAPTHYTITIAYPITGTPLYEEVKETIVEPDSSWQQHTDRDLDFRRRYRKVYYKNALRWINHELRYDEVKAPVLKLRHKVYSLLAQTLMLFN